MNQFDEKQRRSSDNLRFHQLLSCLIIAVSFTIGGEPLMAETAPLSIQADFYVAPNGNDASAGTLEEPFATFQRVRDAVRRLKNTRPAKDIVVLLRGGYYRLSDTIVFGLQDSAAEGHTITYAAYPGERPILGSGIPVTGWKRATGDVPRLPEKARAQVWCAPAPEGIRHVTSLFHGQRTLPRARSAGFVPTGSGQSHTQVHFPRGRIADDAAERGIELRIVPDSPWVVNLLPIAKVDSDKAVAMTSVPGTYALDPVRWGYFPQGTAWIENAVEFLDAPGRWALDTKARRIYFWHEGAKPPSGIVAPKLTELVRVEGKIDYDGPVDTSVRGLVFRGLTFTHADHWRWRPDKTGWGLQHDWEMFDRPTAMLRFRGAEDCVVERCEFAASGAAAIRCDLHAQRIRIARNHVYEVGGVGVLLAGYGPGTKDVNHHNTVVDNHIHHVGQVMWHAPGIFVWQSGNNRIARNHVHHTAYTGIVLSGRIVWSRKRISECSKTLRWKEIDEATGNASREPTWGRGISLTPWRQREPFLHGRRNDVEYNDIHHCMRILGDGNGIYVSGTGDANLIRYNMIHDVDSPSMLAAIRCDDDQHGTVIHGNIIADCCGEGFVIKGANTITNNVVYGLRSRTPDGTRCIHRRGHLVLPYGDCTGAVVERNLFYAVEKRIPVLHEKRKSSRGAALLRQCRADKNLYFNVADPEWGPRHFAAQRKYGIEKQSIAADPLFVNPAQRDFRFKKGSPALTLGFVPINQKLIGPSPDSSPSRKKAEE